MGNLCQNKKIVKYLKKKAATTLKHCLQFGS